MIVTEKDIYPSREENRPRFIPRQDPVVYGRPAEEGGGPLTSDELKTYEDQGFLYFPGFFSSKEVETCRTELYRLCQSSEIKQKQEAIIEPELDELRSLFAVHRICPFFSTLAADERLALMAMQILGSEVYVHQSRVNLKPGFLGKEFYWHSDFETWHTEDGLPRMRTVSFSILLTPNYAINGPLMLVPGSHKTFLSCVGKTPEDHYKMSLRRQEFGVPDNESMRQLVEEAGRIEAPTGPAGSLLIFDCNTMHGSNSNISPFPRSNIFFVYNSVENPIQPPYCSMKPRPEFVASREHCNPVVPAKMNFDSPV